MKNVASWTKLLLVDVYCNVQQFHRLPLFPFWAPTPILKLRNAVQRGDPVTITGRSNASISKKFFHVACLAEIPRFTFLWSIRFILTQIDCKNSSQSQVSSLGRETSRRADLDDLCSSTFRQQRSNLVSQSVTRFYLLVSEVVLGTVSGQSLKSSLVCVKTHTLHFSDLSFHSQLTDFHVFNGAPIVLWHLYSLLSAWS